jgi:hypothetical protein
MEKPNGKRPLGRPRHRWENNMKMDLQEVGWRGLDWIYVEQLVGSCNHSNEPSGSINMGNYLTN